jgi:hypothetical protein
MATASPGKTPYSARLPLHTRKPTWPCSWRSVPGSMGRENTVSKYPRLTIEPFMNWQIRNLPKCVYPQNKDLSKTSMGRRQRDFVLRSYGYKNYTTYLRSELWSSIRAKVLHRAFCACGCGREATQVHHKEYTEANLLGETLHGLVALNGDCHHGIEFDGKRKTRLDEANRQLQQQQFASVANCKPPSKEEIKLFLSGRHKKLTPERKLTVRAYLKNRS